MLVKKTIFEMFAMFDKIQKSQIFFLNKKNMIVKKNCF